MFCEKCGRQINPGAAFCPACGAAVNSAPSENKLKSTFRGSMSNQGQTMQYNSPQASELESPVQTVQSSPQPVYQEQNSYAAYNDTPPITPPGYTAPIQTDNTRREGSGKTANNATERTVLSVIAILFTMFFPIFGFGFFPDNYDMGFEFLEAVFSNFDAYTEVAGAQDSFAPIAQLLIYLIPFGMLICCLMKSRIGNLLLSAVGVGCCTYLFTRVFFEWISIDTDVSFFDCSGLSFGFYLVFAVFILSSSKSKQD